MKAGGPCRRSAPNGAARAHGKTPGLWRNTAFTPYRRPGHGPSERPGPFDAAVRRWLVYEAPVRATCAKAHYGRIRTLYRAAAVWGEFWLLVDLRTGVHTKPSPASMRRRLAWRDSGTEPIPPRGGGEPHWRRRRRGSRR